MTSEIVEEETASILSGAGARSNKQLSDRIQEAIQAALIRRTETGIWIAEEALHGVGVQITADMYTLEKVEVKASFWNGSLSAQRYANWHLPSPVVDGVLSSDYDFICDQFTEGDPLLNVTLLARPAIVE